jgi:hypothetical protein
MDTFRIMQELVGWVHIVVDLAAVVVCLMHAGRSVWARVLAGGFGLQLLVSIFYRVAGYIWSFSGSEARTLSALYFMGSLLGLLASAVIVVGLFGLLSQVAGMMARAYPSASPLVGAATGPVDPA